MNECFLDSIVLADAGMKGDSRLFRLEKDFRVKTSKGLITVPRNFVTEGASIPRVFWNILHPFGPYFGAAIVHDWLYSPLNETFTRLESDLIFKELMYKSGVGFMKRETIYRAVRMFGWKFYRGFEG